MNVYQNTFELIGNTPLVQLAHFSSDVRIYAKLEYANPGGSVKDRLGMFLIEEGIKFGVITEGTTIIEATAGNTGIGLALAAQKYNLPVIMCVPEKFSIEKQMIAKALGARVVVTPTELGMEGAKAKAKELGKEIVNSYIPGQFENNHNPKTYYHSLGPEIYSQLEGTVDVFVAGAGSGGTFTGVASFLKEKNSRIKTVVVEPEGSVLNGGKEGNHLVEGIGMGQLTPFMQSSQFDSIHTITDQEAFYYVRELARKEGLLVGSSSGAAMAAAVKEAEKLSSGNIVVIFPDSSERYLSKNIYEEI